MDYGSWFDYTLQWEKLIHDNPELPVHIMSYEDMKQVMTAVHNIGSGKRIEWLKIALSPNPQVNNMMCDFKPTVLSTHKHIYVLVKYLYKG